MKKLMMLVGIAVTMVAGAEIVELSDAEKKLIDTPIKGMSKEMREKRHAAILHRNMLEEGGNIEIPGKGKLRYCNLQKKVATADLKDALKFFGSHLGYDIAVVDGDCDAEIKIKIVDDPAMPALLLAPEEGWAKVNVAKLATPGTKPAFAAARVRKEMLRAFSYLTAATQYNQPLYGYVKDAKVLDELAETHLPIEVFIRAKRYMDAAGFKQASKMSYRAAIEEGHDIAPTNDYQKAIYTEVKNADKAKK